MKIFDNTKMINNTKIIDNIRIIDNNKINLPLLKKCLARPELYAKSTAKFWDDDYVSEQMLGLHLNPALEAASKTQETIEAETRFIIQLTGMDPNKAVIDLGCGPGLYVREFARAGARVTGIDLAARSVAYANQHIKPAYPNTHFINMNYLDIDYQDSFDLATLIFYDFCALSLDEQNLLLKKIHTALKDNGFFIFDLVTDNKETSPATNIQVWEAGFWSPQPYIEILNTYLYENPKTEGLQYTLIAVDGSTRIIRIYHRLFSLAEITEMLHKNGFRVESVYKNLKGEALGKDSETLGIMARKA